MALIAARRRGRRRSAPSVISLVLIVSLSTGMFTLPANPASTEASRFSGESFKQTVLGNLESYDGYFIENRGQVAAGVRFYSRGNPSVAFKEDAIVVVLSQQEDGDRKGADYPRNTLLDPGFVEEQNVVRSSAYMIHFMGANSVVPLGRTRLPFNNNFFIGNDPRWWRTDVPNYGEVVYQNLYDGIDLVYHSVPGSIKYEFIVHPGADPERIEMEYDGAGQLAIDESGIVINTPLGSVRDSKPYAYQQRGGEVGCAFAKRSIVSYGFECGKWSESESLVIDPLIYSTYLGGALIDAATDIADDSSGNAYVVGLTYSSDFSVTPGAFDTTYNGRADVFVTKLNPAGSSPVYSTFLGGDMDEVIPKISVDSAGCPYVVGATPSINFPTTPGAWDRTLNASDAFVAKLSPTGNALVYSTLLGGNGSELAAGVAVDATGNAFVFGHTGSSDFPTTAGALNRSINGFVDTFVTKLNATGSGLIYSTFLGGTDGDNADGIALDSLGNAYVTGNTYSADFPITPGAFSMTYKGSRDVFVTKLSATGCCLVYSTFLGGNGGDDVRAIEVDSLGNACLTGFTESTNFPTTSGAFDVSLKGGEDAFVTKLNAAGRGLIYSTFLGGLGFDRGSDIALDGAANAIVTGMTGSTDFPTTPDAFDATLNGNVDAFVTGLNATGSALIYSTFLGGSKSDYGSSIAVDSISSIVLAGETDSTDFPVTPGAFSTSYSGNEDAFVTKLGTPPSPDMPDLALAPLDISFDPNGPVVVGIPVTVNATIHNIGKVNASQVVVRFHDGFPPGTPQIGNDKVIVFIQYYGGTGIGSVVWPAGPPGVHEICVVADPDNLIAEADETNNVACRQIEVAFSLQLTPGHRFVSFPLMAADDSIGSVLSSISGCYDYVRWYDPLDAFDHWKSYVPGRGYNDLARLDNTMGFWINITANCSFTPVGTRPVSTTIDLHQGWNMVGFPSFKTAYTVADLRASIGVAGIVVEAFDARASPYYLQRVTDSYVMMAGEGYWVYVPSDAMWNVSG